MQNSDFWIRITSLYGSQTSPVDLRIQNSVLRSRMTLAYWSQPSSGVLCIQNSDFSIRITSLSGSQSSFVDFACKTATLGPELQVSMGPRPNLCFLHSKQRLWHQNCKSLWVQDLTCRFVHEKNVIRITITSLYGSQPSFVVFACTTATLRPELQVSIGPRPHLLFCACKTA